MKKIRNRLKKIALLKILVIIIRNLKSRYGLLKKIKFIKNFFSDWEKINKINNNKNFSLELCDLYPAIFDKTTTTKLDPVYFFQDTWCAKKIFESKPKHHYDIGSKAEMVGIISQFIPTTMIDIRPIELKLEGLSFIEGSILKLPFRDDEIGSLSSICVIEHIGLGRYGDEIDPYGSEKAINEIKRVLALDGNLYISLPVDYSNKIYFNAHRAFTKDYILELFSPLALIEEKYIYGNEIKDKYDPGQGFGTGLYHFRKTSNNNQ